ncbi:alanine:cation symporter family protein [Flavobacterium sp. xlx-214]|uniref:alanine/glycine:cation symporter family protein n=1 Tax=unclassified Flavobacterium TaxID=196869 RepID=UPI0013D675E8|nr:MULTISPECIES: alanine/glycine:cation symporter family protein [unclassified Flavobacterium]MBA5793130.1 alanine:cation symporter family protein [Flavobacterium sp. xlx-221]QMI82583.1 alanine:cation symporter family protein [Flavobacterium sp. xlx-214]
MDKTLEFINSIVWSNALIILCAITGIYFTIRTGFVQFRYIKLMVQLLFTGEKSEKGISPFQAFSLAISGRVGTGNIVGVATAIAMGGPGAVFWMWFIAILGAASAFIESTLGQIYKQEIDGEYRGGPAYYIEKGLGIKWYALLFAFITIISCGLLLPGVQSNSIASAMSNAFNVPISYLGSIPINYMGLIVVFLLGLIIFGGVKRLGKASEIIVPFMAGIYILMALIIIGMNFKQIPAVLELILTSAFNMNATFGGIMGSAIAWGIKRGIYSNEAGQGTAPHAAAASEVKHPAEQGLVQAFSVYIDTLFVCTATAFMILFTNQYNVLDEKNGSLIVEHIKGVDYTGFTQAAVAHHFPSIGNEFVAIALFFFAFTTIMAYYYYAETNIAYIIRDKNKRIVYVWALRVLFLFATYFGTIKEAKTAWAIGDLGVGLMAWVNIIAILLLSNVALKVWNDYKNKRKAGIKDITFNADEVGIKNAEFWKK